MTLHQNPRIHSNNTNMATNPSSDPLQRIPSLRGDHFTWKTLDVWPEVIKQLNIQQLKVIKYRNTTGLI